MKTVKLIIMTYLVAVCALGYSTSYAQENDSPIFLTGKIGNSVGLENCSGNCSATPSGTIGIGFTGGYISNPDLGSINFRNSISLDYSRYQFTTNGNILNVEGKAINFYMEYASKDHPKYIWALEGAPVWTIASSPNTPDYTAFGARIGMNFLYQVNPDLYLSVGATSMTIVNQANFVYKTLDVGLRWYP